MSGMQQQMQRQERKVILTPDEIELVSVALKTHMEINSLNEEELESIEDLSSYLEAYKS